MWMEEMVLLHFPKVNTGSEDVHCTYVGVHRCIYTPFYIQYRTARTTQLVLCLLPSPVPNFNLWILMVSAQ